MEALPALGDTIQAVLNAQRAFGDAHAPNTQTADEPAQRKHRPRAEISEVQDAEAGRNSPSRISAATAGTNSDTNHKMERTSKTHDGEFEVTVQGLSTTGTWKWRDAVRGCINLAQQCTTRTPCFPTGREIDVVHEASVHWQVGPFAKELERATRKAADEQTRKKRDVFRACLVATTLLVFVVVAVALLVSRSWR
jgi:hypothetical protein